MSAQPHPVLVGIDGTPSGLEALDLAGALAVLTDSPLVLGAVFGFESELWPPEPHADRWLHEAEERLGDAIPWTSRAIISTSPAHGLTELARRLEAGWIVLGSSHRGTVGRVVFGSTARFVVHGAPCAVAVVPHGWRLRAPEEPLRFGVAMSDSAESREALAAAAQLAASAHALLRLYTVVSIPSPAHPMFAATGTSYEAWRRDQRRDAERRLRAAIASVAPGVDAEPVVLEGDPPTRLAEVSLDLDLLVVGSRRYGPLRSALLGGVSAPLIELAHAPVLVVPRGVHAQALEPGAAEQVAHA